MYNEDERLAGVMARVVSLVGEENPLVARARHRMAFALRTGDPVFIALEEERLLSKARTVAASNRYLHRALAHLSELEAQERAQSSQSPPPVRFSVAKAMVISTLWTTYQTRGPIWS